MFPNRNISVDIGEGPWKNAARIFMMDEGSCESAGISQSAGIPAFPIHKDLAYIMTSMSLRPPVSSPIEVPRPPVTVKALMSPWKWMAVTCLILGISGGLRYWREWKFASLAVKSEAAPFSLSRLPRVAGSWQAGEGSETQLDPDVARIAGSTDHIVRSYLDEKSGEQASALILYGMAATVFAHTPEACYPSAGYQLVKGPVDGTITLPDAKEPVRYRWAIYVKRVAGISRYEEAYYTFRHNGEWLPDIAGRWKMFRYHPSIFKVQIAHPVSSLSESGKGGACELLLTELVRQIEERLTAGGPGQAVTSAKMPEAAAKATEVAPKATEVAPKAPGAAADRRKQPE
jgi:hypothetical protein